MRILPNEVHLSDQRNFGTIYHVGSKYTKDPVFYGALLALHSTFGTIPNDEHKRKRARLNPMFSRKMVLQLEDIVQAKANKVVALANRCIESGQPADLHHMFRCVSVDVITEYAFDKSYNLLDTPDFGAYFFRMVRGVGPALYIFQQFPFLRDLAYSIPLSIRYHMGGAMRQVARLQQEGVRQLNDVKTRMEQGGFTPNRPTIFSELLDPEKQGGYPVPPATDLKDEVYVILAAAADTTGNAMTVACYKVLQSPEIYYNLRKELLDTFPAPDARLDFVTLEKLPYLVSDDRLRFVFNLGSSIAQ